MFACIQIFKFKSIIKEQINLPVRIQTQIKSDAIRKLILMIIKYALPLRKEMFEIDEKYIIVESSVTYTK